MDDILNKLARELADAIAAVVAEDPRVEAVRERGRAAGYELVVSLEADVGFRSRNTSLQHYFNNSAEAKVKVGRGKGDLGRNARRFLRSLHITAEEEPQDEIE